jgi:hypothetical protein
MLVNVGAYLQGTSLQGGSLQGVVVEITDSALSVTQVSHNLSVHMHNILNTQPKSITVFLFFHNIL